MTDHVSDPKTGFSVVYLHEPNDKPSFEQQGSTIFETYQSAKYCGEETALDLSTPTWKISVKYIIALPWVI